MSYFGRAIALSGLFLLGGACCSSRYASGEFVPVRPNLVSEFADSVTAYSPRLDSETSGKLCRMRDLLLQQRKTPLSPDKRLEVEGIMRRIINGDYSDVGTSEGRRIDSPDFLTPEIKGLESAFTRR